MSRQLSDAVNGVVERDGDHGRLKGRTMDFVLSRSVKVPLQLHGFMLDSLPRYDTWSVRTGTSLSHESALKCSVTRLGASYELLMPLC
jgi:hypothetical protein